MPDTMHSLHVFGRLCIDINQGWRPIGMATKFDCECWRWPTQSATHPRQEDCQRALLRVAWQATRIMQVVAGMGWKLKEFLAHLAEQEVLYIATVTTARRGQDTKRVHGLSGRSEAVRTTRSIS